MTIKMTFKLTDEQLADALMKSIIERIEAGGRKIADGDFRWTTKRNVVYVSDIEVSKDQNIATLVNAYNVLKFGKPKHFK